MGLFEAEARDAGLLPRKQIREMPSHVPVEGPSGSDLIDSGRWTTFVQLGRWGKEEFSKGQPGHVQGTHGKEVSVKHWTDLLLQTAEWLIREGSLTKDVCPVTVGQMTKRYLIHIVPEHPDGRKSNGFKRLSNGLYVECQWDPRSIARRCGELVAKFGQDPAQFHVRLRQ